MRIIFAGGGTGGHLFPALAIAEEIRAKEPAAAILFVGTKKKIEADVVPRYGYEFATIWISGFRRRLRLETLLFPLKVIVAMIQARTIVKRFQPDAVVGTGGYVSGPVLFMASLAGVPTLIQEQNSYPGVTTRLLGKLVDEIHLTYEDSTKYFARRDNLVISGNPTRRGFDNVSAAEAAAYFGFAGTRRPTLLVVGGSLGAHSLNAAFMAHAAELVGAGYRIIWQTGTADAEAVNSCCKNIGSAEIWARPFIERMDYAYALSDLVVCRAGATTLAELARTGKPAVLVPYPFAAANHQMANALSVKRAGAAEIVEDEKAGADLIPAVRAIVDGGRLGAMAAASKLLAKPDAARVIAGRVLALAGRA